MMWVNYSIIYVYMNLAKNNDEEQYFELGGNKNFFNAIDQSQQIYVEFSASKGILNLMPYELIFPPYVDADHKIAKPITLENIIKRGILTEEPFTLILEQN
ncbi:unnamed protein product [Paramecium sonneborni]|uniref:Uncharacterized protein n=1 Tax=Paramecium sonneborni TaxID=65129 RepID=A0A8S1LID0_9CILI|nr:unnamed protein product [Paramecium sonneborni]